MSTFVDRSPEALKFFERCGVRFRVVRGVTDHYYGKSPGSHAAGRSVEVDLISGFDLGDWRERVSAPDDVPCFVTAEEQIAWGGINSFSHWDQDLVRRAQAAGHARQGAGLDLPFPEGAACPRRDGADRSAGGTPCGRKQAGDRRRDAFGRNHQCPQRGHPRHRRLQRQPANELGVRAASRHSLRRRRAWRRHL